MEEDARTDAQPRFIYKDFIPSSGDRGLGCSVRSRLLRFVWKLVNVETVGTIGPERGTLAHLLQTVHHDRESGIYYDMRFVIYSQYFGVILFCNSLNVECKLLQILSTHFRSAGFAATTIS